MSKLNELIQRLSPDGVEFKPLGEVCILSRGKVYSKDYLKDNPGEFPVYSSQTANNGELGRINTYDCEGDYLTWTTDGAHAGTIFHRTGKFSITNVCGLIKIKESNLYIRFLYYWLSIKAKGYVNQGMGNPKLMTNQIEVIPIPLPPLPVQEEIVRLLDQLTETTQKYQAELEAELDARKIQYEEYRDQLLSFDASRTDVEWKALNDCCVVQRGIRVVKKNLMEEGTVPVFQNSIAPMGYYDKSNYPANVSYIICAGSSSGSIGFCTVPFWAADDCLCVLSKEDIDNKFIYYYLQAQHSYIKTKVRGGAMPRLSRQVVENLKFPIISLTEQERIVNILDRMEKTSKELCKSIEDEIKMRKQQYEYYRNQLLDFKRKEV